MLIRFSVENFRSICEQKSISFISNKKIKDKPISNIAEVDGEGYLRSLAIYGANSSGKSNLIKALVQMKDLIRRSIQMNDGDELSHNPFSLDLSSDQKPSMYEAEFLVNGIHYRYGFSNDKERICEEWLIRIEEDKQEIALFKRNLEGIGINSDLFVEGEGLEEKTNDNRLFLSLVGQLNGKIANEIIQFFNKKIGVISGLDSERYEGFSKFYLDKKDDGCEKMKSFFRQMQLGFINLTSESREFDESELPESLPKELREKLIQELKGGRRIDVYSSHRVYDEDGATIETRSFDFDEMESAGTQKLFAMAGPIFDTLNSGSILVIDELDAKMHPLISREIVSLFNSPKQNPMGAQLLFTTHDTNLLSSGLLRRDQIWFTEKDNRERTDIYNMMDIYLPNGCKPRGDGNIERNYIRGRYGAIPYIQNDNHG